MTAMTMKAAAVSIALAVLGGGLASDFIPNRYERFSRLDTRTEAISEAGKAIAERYAGREITEWKLCEATNVAAQYVLVARLGDSLQNGYANIRATRWGWRIQARHPNERFNAGQCENIDIKDGKK